MNSSPHPASKTPATKRRFISIALLTLVMSVSIFNLAVAQTTLTGIQTDHQSDSPTTITTESPEAIRNMVSRLSDQEVRALLLDRLDAVAEATANAQSDTESTSAGALSFIKFWGAGVFDALSVAVSRLPILVSKQVESFQNFGAQRGSAGTLAVLGWLALALAVGFLAEWLIRRLTRKWSTLVNEPPKENAFSQSFKLLSLRFFLDLIGLIGFLIATIMVIKRMPTPADTEMFSLIVFNMVFFPRLIMTLARFLFAPNRPEMRLVHTDDWTAKFIYKHSWGLYALIGFGASIVFFNEKNGIPVGLTRFGFWITLLVHLYVVYIAWHARDGLKMMLIGKKNDVTPMEESIAKLYPYFLMAFSVLIWLIVELIASLGAFHIIREQPQSITLLIFLFIPAFDTLIRACVANLVPPMQGDGVIATRAYNSTKRSYLRIGRVIVFGLVVLLLVDIWHIKLNTVASDAVGASVASHFIRLVIILSIGYLIWEIVSLLFNRKLAAEDTAAGFDLNQEEPGGGEGGGTGASRLSTILPLFRFTVQTIVIAMTILIALSNIGINATPLLAGAGVVGIAVGFGAQKLVTDIVSGIFFLIDDAFRAGEYISIDGTVGTVEKISLRSMQLRHHRGAVHTIPYGEIPQLTNYSRDWVLMKLKFTVPFDTDLKKVKNLFKQIGKDVVDLPQFSDDLLQPFKSQGVLEVNDVGIVVGGKFMAKPGTQFMMRKELFLRVQKAFDDNGIQFARKEVRVKLDGNENPEDLTQDQATTIAGVAASAIDEPNEAVPAPK